MYFKGSLYGNEANHSSLKYGARVAVYHILQAYACIHVCMYDCACMCMCGYVLNI